MAHSFDSESLISWFEEEKRDLPWRVDPAPYRVWVSEVMLQQTQVSVVIPYFERWMERFPTIKHLSQASVDEVIKMWEGLGYYSRARNLHQGAKTIYEKFNGKLPSDENELASIKGLGPYTIGAIRSFAFHQKTPAVDGNVVRVIARYFAIRDDIAKGPTVKKLRDLADSILPDDKHWIVNEGLIELGATICGKKPSCNRCPINKGCLSFRDGAAGEIPYKSTRFSSIPLFRSVGVLVSQDCLLVRRGGKGKIMHDLHEFPYFETTEEGLPFEALVKIFEGLIGTGIKWIEPLPEVSHSFTKYRAKLSPHLFSVKEKVDVDGYVWQTPEQLRELAFSSGHRKIYESLRVAKQKNLML